MASFTIPRRAPVLVLAEPDFSKIDCNWEVNRLLQSEIARDLLWSILFLSALAETYHTITPLVETWESLEPVV